MVDFPVIVAMFVYAKWLFLRLQNTARRVKRGKFRDGDDKLMNLHI
jgi:hypothetical protein